MHRDGANCRMDKTKLSESDIGDKFIRPALVQGGWDSMEQIFAQYPLRAGRVVVRGNKAYRDESTVLRADYALFYKPNIPLAIVEAKKSRLSMSAGMQQAIAYAQLLDVPFSFSSNGDGFVFRDATLATGVLEQNLTLEELLRRTARGQRLLHFFRQALLQVLVDLAGADIEDAADAEVEFGAVDLKDLAQLGDEFVVFAHVRLLVFAQVRCAQA